MRAVLRRRFRASPGPAPFQVSPVKLPVSNRENLSPAAGREDEANLRQRFLSEPAAGGASACTKRQVAATILGHFAGLYVRHRYYGGSAGRTHRAQAQAGHSGLRRTGEARRALP
jgi:hypothetical protein